MVPITSCRHGGRHHCRLHGPQNKGSQLNAVAVDSEESRRLYSTNLPKVGAAHDPRSFPCQMSTHAPDASVHAQQERRDTQTLSDILNFSGCELILPSNR